MEVAGAKLEKLARLSESPCVRMLGAGRIECGDCPLPTEYDGNFGGCRRGRNPRCQRLSTGRETIGATHSAEANPRSPFPSETNLPVWCRHRSIARRREGRTA